MPARYADSFGMIAGMVRSYNFPSQLIRWQAPYS